MDTASFSLLGSRKPDNQDSLAIDEARGLMVVCDGVTHCDGGGIASQTAVEEFVEHLLATEPIDRHGMRFALNRAHDTLRKDRRQLFTTLDAVVVQDDRILHVHVGDGRIYLIKDSVLERITVDQVEGRYLSNALGIPRIKFISQSMPRTPDIKGVVIMSDGVWNEISDPELEAALTAGSSAAERATAIEASLREPPPADDATLAIALF